MATQDQKTQNGFVSGEALPMRAPDHPPEDQELADFLARAAVASNCQASSFAGRKVCREMHGLTPVLVFADEATLASGKASWDVSAEIADLAERQALFMQGLGKAQTPAAAPGEQAQNSAEAFAALLARCSHEIQQDGRVIYQLDKSNIFVDHGRQLLMEPAADRNEEAILVALLLAKEKFKTFELTGDADFQRRALEIMVRYDLDVPLKNAAQQALKDELVKARDAERSAKKDNQAPAAASPAQPASAAGEKAAQPANGVVGGNKPAPSAPDADVKPAKAPATEATRCVDAHAWWQSQVAIINSAARSDKEKEEQLHTLGPAPAEGKAWWFDSAGNPRPQPKDPETVRKLREAAGMAASDTPAVPKAQVPPAVVNSATRPSRRSAPFAR